MIKVLGFVFFPFCSAASAIILFFQLFMGPGSMERHVTVYGHLPGRLLFMSEEAQGILGYMNSQLAKGDCLCLEYSL